MKVRFISRVIKGTDDKKKQAYLPAASTSLSCSESQLISTSLRFGAFIEFVKVLGSSKISALDLLLSPSALPIEIRWIDFSVI